MKILLLATLFCLLGTRTSLAAIFHVKPNSDLTKCLRVTNNGVANGDGLSVATCDLASNWYLFQEDGNGTTSVTTFYTGQSDGCRSVVLAGVAGLAPNGAPTDLVKQVLLDPTSRAQYWIQSLPPGGWTQPAANYFWYKNLASGKCMTSEFNGNYMDNYACSNGALHQFWSVNTADPAAGGLVKVKSQAVQNLLIPCLKVNGGNPSGYPGADTSMALCMNGEYQQGFIPLVVNAKMWKNMGSNKCIDGGSTSALVFQYDCTPTALNHNWLGFNYESDGTNIYTRFLDLLSGLCLTWDSASQAVNTVRTDPCDPNNVNQQWRKTA